MRLWAVLGLFGILAGTNTALAAGDPAAGAQVFKKCGICHSPEPDTDKSGPTLFGIVGRKSAASETFFYSKAMMAANRVWDEKNLDAFLTNPAASVPGTKMVFPGLASEQDRADLIAYLATLK
jgi:cytochrome c